MIDTKQQRNEKVLSVIVTLGSPHVLKACSRGRRSLRADYRPLSFPVLFPLFRKHLPLFRQTGAKFKADKAAEAAEAAEAARKRNGLKPLLNRFATLWKRKP